MASNKRRAWSESLELDRIIDSRKGTGRDSRTTQNEGLGRKWVVLRTSFSGICAQCGSRCHGWDLSEKGTVSKVLISPSTSADGSIWVELIWHRCGARRSVCCRRTVAPTVFASQLVSYNVSIVILVAGGCRLV